MASSSVFHECESTLDLGFVEDTPAWLLASRFFRSKVGGRPAWLDLKNLPSTEELSCNKCGNPMILLLQIYAPLNENAKCFHRVIFVFMCGDSACHMDDLTPFKVFRSQLCRKNEFYPYESPVETSDWKVELNVTKFVQICRACGCLGSKKCSGCGKVSYCSRNCQMIDWKARHKKECKNSDFVYSYREDEEVLPNLLLPQHEIVIQGDDEIVSESDDEDDEESGKKVDEKKELEKLKELEQSGGVLSVSSKDLADFSTEDEVIKDKNFKRFQKVVKCAPDQVIRYQRSATPLWISANNIPNENQIPNCEICGSKRIFEFQIMPQLLSELKLDNSLEEKSVDWGTLAVYTCESSCSDGSKSYKPEFIWKQII